MRTLVVILALALSGQTLATAPAGVRLKELARIQGVRDNALVGYGLLVGLAGTGDSSRNRATVQSLVNTLANFGVAVDGDDLASRNAAAVMVTATLPAFAEAGQRLDVQVSSLGDARSLTGGTLLLTPLYGADERLYALAQGALSVGGYKVDQIGNMVQKNHPTVGVVPGGATVERAIAGGNTPDGRQIDVLLHQPDFTTAERVATALRQTLPGAKVSAAHAGRISVAFEAPVDDPVDLIARIENAVVHPDQRARVVVNERTGTVVAGGDVRLGDVSISQGELRVEITTRFNVSQPDGLLFRPSESIRTAVVPEVDIKTSEGSAPLVTLPEGTTVAELVDALRAIRLSTRDVITILQSIKAAGALHGDLIIQ